MTNRDDLYANPLAAIAGFTFNEAVVDVFPDMIRRSVPGYEAIVKMIGELAERYAQPHTCCYDLGCSLGAATLAMRTRISANAHCRLVAVDNSPAMIRRCEQVLAADGDGVPVELVCADIEELSLQPASVVVLNFTLQFVPQAQRDALIQHIHQALVPGGVLIVSEKISFADAHYQALMTELHHNFKRANGYSELEIAQKRSALDNVLVPETLDSHRQRLQRAGFSSGDVWFQCLNFASLLAIKGSEG